MADLQMLGAVGVGRDERQIDIGRAGRAQFLLGLFAGLLQTLQGHGVFAQVDPLLFFEFVGHPIDQHLIEVVAAQVRIAVGGDDAEHAVGHFQHRHVEGAAAQVEHDDLFVFFAFQAVGQRGRGRLVDDAGNFQTGDLPGVFGRLPLGVVEIGRNGDDRLVDLVAEIGLGRFLQLAENLGRDFRRSQFFVADANADVVVGPADDLVGDDFLFAGDLVMPPAHEALDRVNRPLGIGDRLAASQISDEHVSLVGERHDARGEPVAFLVGNDLGLFAFHHGHDRIRRAEVDTDDFFALSHTVLLLSTKGRGRRRKALPAGRRFAFLLKIPNARVGRAAIIARTGRNLPWLARHIDVISVGYGHRAKPMPDAGGCGTKWFSALNFRRFRPETVIVVGVDRLANCLFGILPETDGRPLPI